MKSYYIIILCIFPFLKIYGEQSHVDSLFIHANNMSLQGIINLGNANQKNPWDSTLHQSEWLRSKIQLTADAGEDVEKEEHSSIVGGIASLYNHSGNQSGGSSENWT